MSSMQKNIFTTSRKIFIGDVRMIGSPDSTLEYHEHLYIHTYRSCVTMEEPFVEDGVISTLLYPMQFIVSHYEFCGMLITSEFYM